MRKLLFITSILCCVNLAFADPVLQTQNCWSASDKADSAFAALETELGQSDSGYKLSIKSTEDCSPVSGAQVTLGSSFSATSDSFGEVMLPLGLFAGMGDGELTLKITKPDFIDYLDKMKVFFNEPHSSDTFILLSPVLPPSSARVVLTWWSSPRDLDLHLYGPNGMHVYYNGPRAGGAFLNQDDRHGFGHEIITVNNIDLASLYRFYVHNYSREADITTARAKLYHDNTLVRNVELFPTDRPAVLVYRLRNGNWGYPNIPTTLP